MKTSSVSCELGLAGHFHLPLASLPDTLYIMTFWTCLFFVLLLFLLDTPSFYSPVHGVFLLSIACISHVPCPSSYPAPQNQLNKMNNI